MCVRQEFAGFAHKLMDIHKNRPRNYRLSSKNNTSTYILTNKHKDEVKNKPIIHKNRLLD